MWLVMTFDEEYMNESSMHSGGDVEELVVVELEREVAAMDD